MYPASYAYTPALAPGVAGHELLNPSSRVSAKPPQPTVQQPLCGAMPFAVDPSVLQNYQHTQNPIVTGTSVLAVKYKDGVLLAADMLGSYGSTKRYKSLERVIKVNDSCVIAASGEYSDFQQITEYLEELTTDDYRMDDGIKLGPQEVFAYLCRVMYNRRNKFDPLWNSLIVGGMQGETPFLGLVGMTGNHYTDSHATTGYANGLARPLMRERQRDDMSEEEATELLYDCLRTLSYRDKQSLNKYLIGKVTKNGASISEPFALETKWDFKVFQNPTKFAVGAW